MRDSGIKTALVNRTKRLQKRRFVTPELCPPSIWRILDFPAYEVQQIEGVMMTSRGAFAERWSSIERDTRRIGVARRAQMQF
jgi:hypothetical protein